MSFGLSIEGANQRILLNESKPGIFFKGKYTATYSSGWTTTVTGCNSMPLVFIKTLGTDYKTSIYSMVDNGSGSWTISLAARTDTGTNTNSSSQEIGDPYPGDLTFYVFDILGSADAVTSGYGMLVYDDNSNPVFTTNKKLLKITGYHVTSSVYIANEQFNVSTQTITSGTIPTDYAVLCGAVGDSWINVDIQLSLICPIGVRRLTSTTMKFGITGVFHRFNPAPYVQSNIFANHQLLFINHTDYD